MAVYFVTEKTAFQAEPMLIKVGYSADVIRRKRQLQTGNPRKLVLMGQIVDSGSVQGRALEAYFHQQFSAKRSCQSEWFYIEPKDVLSALKSNAVHAYISVGTNPFEIISFDRDAVPEFASPWNWGDVESDEFCPVCGWAAGWTYSENWGSNFCLECGASDHDYETSR